MRARRTARILPGCSRRTPTGSWDDERQGGLPASFWTRVSRTVSGGASASHCIRECRAVSVKGYLAHKETATPRGATTGPYAWFSLRQPVCRISKFHRNVNRFRGGLAVKTHILCVSLNSRRGSNTEEEELPDQSVAPSSGRRAGVNRAFVNHEYASSQVDMDFLVG